MYEIREGFTNHKGQRFDNIREIRYENIEEAFGNFGTLVAQTHGGDSDVDSSLKLHDGIYLFKTNYDPKKALRLYKDYADYKFIFYDDEKIVSKLQEKQPLIKLTEFPTGVVTIGGKVVGQEVPYYENTTTLYKAFKDKKITNLPTHYYLEVLKILKELSNNDIVYSDIHFKNILMNLTDQTLRLIDFESTMMSFDGKSASLYQTMVNYLKFNLKQINNLYNISFDESINKATTLEEVEECIVNLDNSLKVKSL